jgi:hypothetical protein
MRVAALGVRMLRAGSALAYGSCESCCSCCLRECSQIRRVFNLCVAVTSAGLDTVRVVHDQVVDIVVEIRVSLPVVAPIAVLLVQVLVCTEPRC